MKKIFVLAVVVSFLVGCTDYNEKNLDNEEIFKAQSTGKIDVDAPGNSDTDDLDNSED